MLGGRKTSVICLIAILSLLCLLSIYQVEGRSLENRQLTSFVEENADYSRSSRNNDEDEDDGEAKEKKDGQSVQQKGKASEENQVGSKAKEEAPAPKTQEKKTEKKQSKKGGAMEKLVLLFMNMKAKKPKLFDPKFKPPKDFKMPKFDPKDVASVGSALAEMNAASDAEKRKNENKKPAKAAEKIQKAMGEALAAGKGKAKELALKAQDAAGKLLKDSEKKAGAAMKKVNQVAMAANQKAQKVAAKDLAKKAAAKMDDKQRKAMEKALGKEDKIHAMTDSQKQQKERAEKERAKEKAELAKACNCQNGGVCMRGNCQCDWQWEGPKCEIPSKAVRDREMEMDRVSNLSKAISSIATQVDEMERSGSASAIAQAVEAATSRQLKDFEMHKNSQDFKVFVKKMDWLSADRVVAAINTISRTQGAIFQKKLDLARAKQGVKFNPNQTIKKMPVPKMHPDAYKHWDVTKANNIDLKDFAKAMKQDVMAKAIHREFTLEYGEPV